MEWFIAVIAVAALGVAAMAAAGGMGQMSREPVYDTYRQDLPDRPLGSEDIRELRFGIALRGYAMGQVDDVLDRLAAEIAVRDARIAELTSRPSPDPAEAAGPQPPVAVGHPRQSGASPTHAESDVVDPDGPQPPHAQYDAG
jgi:DivIVA domain-containing protein